MMHGQNNIKLPQKLSCFVTSARPSGRKKEVLHISW